LNNTEEVRRATQLAKYYKRNAGYCKLSGLLCIFRPSDQNLKDIRTSSFAARFFLPFSGSFAAFFCFLMFYSGTSEGGSETPGDSIPSALASNSPNNLSMPLLLPVEEQT
jgi:hypothetical protein